MKGLKQPFDSIFAKLQASAVRDPLTGVYNRHGFRLAAQHEMNAASQRGSGVATLMADLDNFKRVNDTFGHQAGDEVLKQFASILTASVKPTDTVARLGGDESWCSSRRRTGRGASCRRQDKAFHEGLDPVCAHRGGHRCECRCGGLVSKYAS